MITMLRRYDMTCHDDYKMKRCTRFHMMLKKKKKLKIVSDELIDTQHQQHHICKKF
jgi:hypothetical protein